MQLCSQVFEGFLISLDPARKTHLSPTSTQPSHAKVKARAFLNNPFTGRHDRFAKIYLIKEKWEAIRIMVMPF